MAGNCFSMEPVSVPKITSKFRKITTKIPVPESLEMFERMSALESRSMHGQIPVVWDRAEDFQIYDKWGNIWIDFTSTIFVTNAGHANGRIVNGLKKLLDKPLLHTYTYLSQERLDYLEYLVKVTPSQFEKAFLLSAGTETTEVALKLMRMHGQLTHREKTGVICFSGAYHGRTAGALMMSGQSSSEHWLRHPDPLIFKLPFPFPWEVKKPEEFFEIEMAKLLRREKLDPAKNICGFMIETYQGWGAIFYPDGFIEAVQDFAHKHGILITFDEMQAGFGRTGKLLVINITMCNQTSYAAEKEQAPARLFHLFWLRLRLWICQI